MNKETCFEEIKNARKILIWGQLSKDEGKYFKVSKKEARLCLKNFFADNPLWVEVNVQKGFCEGVLLIN